VALGAYAQAIVYGLLAFAPLGPSGVAYGVYAGLASALLGGLIGAVAGKAPAQFGGPRSSTALILAGSLLGFMSTVSDHASLMALVSLEISLAGLLIAFAQRQKLGQLMQYLPAPVLIGMNTTLGLFSAYKLLPAMAGFAVYTTLPEAFTNPQFFSPLTVGISTCAVTALVYFRVVRPNPLGLVYALLLGLALHTTVTWGLGASANQPELAIQTVGTGPMHPLWDSGLTGMALAWLALPDLLIRQPELLLQVAVGAAVIALLVILESMQSLLQVDQTLSKRHNTRRELNTLAAANVVCGVFLALPSSNYFSRSNAGLGMGTRSRQSEAWCVVVLAMLLAVSVFWIAHLPVNVLATAVAISSLFLIQGHTVRLLEQFVRPGKRRNLTANQKFTVWVVLIMLSVTALGNLLIGTLAGVLCVAAYFLRDQSSSGLRSIEINPPARSRTLRPKTQRDELQAAFVKLAWVRFEGSLFFGNAWAVGIRMEDELPGQRALLLDFSHLLYLDDTANACLQRLLAQPLKHLRSHTAAVLPDQTNLPGNPCEGMNVLRETLLALNISTHSHVDDAFWHLENGLLAGVPNVQNTPPGTQAALQASHLCDGLSPVQINAVLACLTTEQLPAGQVLFHEGDPPSGLYLLVSGQLSAWHQTHAFTERLMRFSQGSWIGEISLIDHKPRSATLRADSDCVLAHLPVEQFNRLCQQQPELAQQITQNLAREMALRLRLANQSMALAH